MITIANTIAISLYLLAAALQGRHLLNLSKQPPTQRLLLGLGLGAVIAHGVSAIFTIYHEQIIDIGFYRVSSLIFCVISALTLISLLRRPTNTLVVALYPLAALSILASSFAAPVIVLSQSMSPGMFAHILISILAYSLLTIATIQAITLSLQERHLKHHHMGGILKTLPPLQTMEQILFELLWIGMALLSLSLLSGFIFIDDIFAQHLAHKTFFSILAWCLYATLLWGRHQLGWRSQTAARWTIGGFISLMLAYYGSKLVLEFILGGGQ